MICFVFSVLESFVRSLVKRKQEMDAVLRRFVIDTKEFFWDSLFFEGVQFDECMVIWEAPVFDHRSCLQAVKLLLILVSHKTLGNKAWQKIPWSWIKIFNNHDMFFFSSVKKKDTHTERYKSVSAITMMVSIFNFGLSKFYLPLFWDQYLKKLNLSANFPPSTHLACLWWVAKKSVTLRTTTFDNVVWCTHLVKKCNGA